MSVMLKKSFKYFICLMALGISLAAVVSAEHEASDSIMVFSGELIAKRQLVEAESVLNGAIWEDPDYAPLYIQRGIIFGMQTKFEQAIPDFTKGIELDPKMPEAFYSRGLAYTKTDDDKKALLDYNKAIELSPSYASAYYNRGLVYYRLANYDAAFDDFTKTVQLDPGFAKAFYRLGLIYDLRAMALQYLSDSASLEIRTENLEMEIQNYDRAISLDPKYIDAIYNRGLAFLKTTKFRKSEKDFLRVIFLDPKSREARFNLGAVYERMKQYGDAKKQFEIYLKDAPAVDSIRVKELTEKFPVLDKWQKRVDEGKARDKAGQEKKSEE